MVRSETSSCSLRSRARTRSLRRMNWMISNRRSARRTLFPHRRWLMARSRHPRLPLLTARCQEHVRAPDMSLSGGFPHSRSATEIDKERPHDLLANCSYHRPDCKPNRRVFRTSFAAAWRRYWDWRARRMTAHILRSLDARTLRDIGISAGEIEFRGLWPARRPQMPVPCALARLPRRVRSDGGWRFRSLRAGDAHSRRNLQLAQGFGAGGASPMQRSRGS